MTVLAQGRAHYQHGRRRIWQVPPRFERRLRISHIARITLRAGLREITARQLQRGGHILRLGSQLPAQAADFAGDRVGGSEREMFQHLVVRTGHERGGDHRRRKQ